MSENKDDERSKTLPSGSSARYYPSKTATVSEERDQVVYTPGQLKTIADAANYIPPKTRIRMSDRDGLLGTVLRYFRPKRRSRE